MTELELVQLIEGHGVHVIFLPYHLAGAYRHDLGLIVVDSRLSQVEQMCVLAHEYAHALRGDNGPQPPHVEARCDLIASGMLISPAEYALAEALYPGDSAAIAVELGVTARIVEAYQSALRLAG